MLDPVDLAGKMPGPHLSIVPMISGINADGAPLQEIIEFLTDVAAVFEQDPAIYEALVEAAYNSVLHAYPNDTPARHMSRDKRWWATACWLPDENVVKFYVYDQGVGIPSTLPRWSSWEELRGMIKNWPLVGAAINDQSLLIEAAIEVSRTSRPNTGHGNGLSDVVRPIKELKGGLVRI